jgi:hypothetical protein
MDQKKLDAAMDELLRDYRGPEDVTGPNGLLKQLTKALLERTMKAELSHHLGYEKHEVAGRGSGNSRNGASHKLVKGDFGEVGIAIPRDREGSFEPKILPKHERRFTGFDDKILSMYARGMSTRDIQNHPGRDLSGGSQRVADQRSHRRRDGRGPNLAEPAAGPDLSDRLPECADGEDATRRACGKPRCLRGHRHHDGRKQGSTGAVEQCHGRLEVLAADSDGSEESPCQRDLHRLCGWVERIPGSDQRRVSPGGSAAL